MLRHAGVALLVVAASAARDPTCSLESVRQPWDAAELPLVFYADQTCPNEQTGRVDDSAIWHAMVVDGMRLDRNTSGDLDAFTHTTNKSIGALQRPSGLMVAGGDLYWLEQDAGILRRCPVSLHGPAGCRGAPETLLAVLNCPQDFAIDFVHNFVYVLQYGGGNGSEAALSCGGEGRITRFPLQPAADGSTPTVDVVGGLQAPRFLALDPLYTLSYGGTRGGLLFWTDPGHQGGTPIWILT
jgi:hypothetical protein